jgi:UDP-glucose:(heptosyl)LPS alpha-1,3-glucosyltransferase
MRIAFGIVSLFPGRGLQLQRDCVDIAGRVRELGHEVTLFTSRRSGNDFASDLDVQLLPSDAHTNHYTQDLFSKRFIRQSAGQFDLVVGFDELAGLGVLYCSDRSMPARVTRNALLRLLPRYRRYIDLEQACFAPNGTTKILLLSEPQLNEYWNCWTTEQSRMTTLSPTLSPIRQRLQYGVDGTRSVWRARLGLSNDDWTWITVCVQPKTRGVDRTVRALRHFPGARLLISGLDRREAKSIPIVALARHLDVFDRIQRFGHCEDIPALMAAADVMVHPARYDTTGTVILEAIANGLPTVTTATCGYARHVSLASAGSVIHEPFSQRARIAALERARDPVQSVRWSASAAVYGRNSALYEGRLRAAEMIVAGAQERSAVIHNSVPASC